MDIATKIIKLELKLEPEPTENIKCESEEIFIENIKIKGDPDIVNQSNMISGTTLKRDMYELTIKEDEISTVKEEPSSDNDMEEVVRNIKTEELMLKSESEYNETGNGQQVVKQNEFCCYSCAYRTPRKYDLQRHISAKHMENSFKKYVCDFCDYRARRKCYLTKHVLMKHNKMYVKLHVCHICDYSTHEKRNFKRHMMLKHDQNAVKQHICDICSYKTYLKNDLKRHLIKHNKHLFKQHGCDFCEYRTHHKTNLKQHTLVWHEKMKRNVMTNHSDNLLEYYICYICEFRTKQKTYLKRHIKYKHNKNMETNRNDANYEQLTLNKICHNLQ